MKTYYDSGEAAWQASNTMLQEYPNYHHSLTAYASLPLRADYTLADEPHVISIDRPSPLIVRALDELKMADRSTTRVLDLGCGTASQSLFLAANGYEVTAMDTNATALDMAHETARSLGIPSRNFVVKTGNALELPTAEKYDVIIAGMLLHFFKKEDNRNIVRQMKSITLPNGLNLLSAYTTNNPEEERLQGREYLFQPQELQSLYAEEDWHSVSYVERLNQRPLARGRTKFIVPTIAELIAKKGCPPKRLGRTALGRDIEYWRRSDPELYNILLDMSEQD